MKRNMKDTFVFLASKELFKEIKEFTSNSKFICHVFSRLSTISRAMACVKADGSFGFEPSRRSAWS